MLPAASLTSTPSSKIDATVSLHLSSSSPSSSVSSSLAFQPYFSLHRRRHSSSFTITHVSRHARINTENKRLRVLCASENEALKVMISGAPASGKGTQCELIVQNMLQRPFLVPLIRNVQRAIHGTLSKLAPWHHWLSQSSKLAPPQLSSSAWLVPPQIITKIWELFERHCGTNFMALPAS